MKEGTILERYRKKIYRLVFLSSANRRYVRRAADEESIISADSSKLFIITVAFNNAKLIALQHKALKKFIQDPYEYFVMDNSNREDERAMIRKYCADNRINYVRLPKNSGWNGMSHGFALNWTYRNIIERFKPARFGFMDHDLFPFRPVSVENYLSFGDAWGISTMRRPTFRPWEKRIYLWIGLAFFRSEKFKHNAPNFLPAFGVDTGGRIPLDPDILMRAPDVHDFFHAEVMEIAPNVRIRRYGNFVHFEGSTDEPRPSLDAKIQWMEDVLRS